MDEGGYNNILNMTALMNCFFQRTRTKKQLEVSDLLSLAHYSIYDTLYILGLCYTGWIL